jgi:hypothetical protein
MDASFCVEAVEDALLRYGKPEIFNTDQRSQLTGNAFPSMLSENGTAISMDGPNKVFSWPADTGRGLFQPNCFPCSLSPAEAPLMPLRPKT